MATPTEQLQAYAQKIYLVIKNRYFDEIESEDGQVFISQVIDWTNMFLDELENEQNIDGSPVSWWWTRQLAAQLGTAVENATSIPLDSSIHALVTDQQRYVQIVVDGEVKSNWNVVAPQDMANRSQDIRQDMVTMLPGALNFSRALKDTEAGGIIQGDITTKLPRIAANNVKILSTIDPQQLLILGVAKNASLPDIVQGKLSPSYVQRYNDMLEKALARSNATTVTTPTQVDDLSGIGGIY